MRNVLILICLCFGQCFGFKHFVLISAPGSGKGTFSQYLVEKYGFVQVCPGDIFRSEIRAQTDLGKRIQPIVDRGDYVDEETVCELIANHLTKIIDQQKGIILDGFPRSKISFEFLHKFFQEYGLSKDVCFLQFIISDDVCVNRILERQVCVKCFKVYNASSVRPKEHNKCDDCAIELVSRQADTEAIFKKRLGYFHRYVEPLVEIAKQFYAVKFLDSERPVEVLRAEYDMLVS